jgi:AcrR family transcriptional regulator
MLSTTTHGYHRRVPDRPYHHGHLRTTLLTEAERVLREHGVDGLSLRDLAREAGVSHAAPRRHFATRQALLDALAEEGFARLAAQTRAVAEHVADSRARLHAVATGFVEFATRNAALLELMFTVRREHDTPTLRAAAERLFSAAGEIIAAAQRDGTLPPGDPLRMQVLFVAALQGIAALATSGRIPPGEVAGYTDDAVALFARPQGG